jgi:hypothetical protein
LGMEVGRSEITFSLQQSTSDRAISVCVSARAAAKVAAMTASRESAWFRSSVMGA